MDDWVVLVYHSGYILKEEDNIVSQLKEFVVYYNIIILITKQLTPLENLLEKNVTNQNSSGQLMTSHWEWSTSKLGRLT